MNLHETGPKVINCYPLPETESFVDLRLLDGGSFTASAAKLHQGVKDEPFRMYNWAFHIFEPQSGHHVLWDLGLTEDKEDYTPWVQKYMMSEVQPVGPRRSIQEQLKQRGVDSKAIGTVIFSHAHWDHCRPIRTTFPQATCYFGPGTKEYCSPGHLVNGEPDPTVEWDGRFFDPLNASEKWQELRGPWQKFGPFDQAMDFFGNGSFWVIQAPGHMPGNLCAAAKLAGGEWVVLGSDCCHSRELFDGVYEIAVFSTANGLKASLQADIPAAKGTIARIKAMEKKLGMHIAFAHDVQWMKDGSDKVLLSLLDEDMQEAVERRIPQGQIP